MTKEEFDKYRFFANTEVLVENYGWTKVIEVNFGNHEIVTEGRGYVSLNKIIGIRQHGE